MTADFRLHEYAAAKRRPRGAQRNGPVTVTRVWPVVMAEVLRLADGDRSRLRVLSATEVLVCNGPRTALYATLSRPRAAREPETSQASGTEGTAEVSEEAQSSRPRSWELSASPPC
jgi:hypothetical protein